jgi:chitin disaccharide deacetylase
MKYVLVVVLMLLAVVFRPAVAEEQDKEAIKPAGLSSVELGWPADARLMMIHGDDIGMCQAANAAAREALTDGRINSCSIMMPCPWAYDFCMWAKDHPEYDIGLHITLTSEWKTYKWGPVLGASKVPSLCDKNGHLWPDVLPVALRAKPEDVEKEIRAQVELALKWGVKPTHLDTHMGTVFGRPEFIQAFMKVAREFGITPFLIQPNENFFTLAKKRGVPVTPQLIKMFNEFPSAKLDYFTYPETKKSASFDERKAELIEQIRKLKPGVTCMIIHPSILTPELESITGSAKTRDWEFKVFAEPDVRQVIKDEKIELVTWRELAKRRPMPKPTTKEITETK